MRVRFILFLCFVLLLNGCATTEVLYTWSDEDEAPRKLNKFFVVGVIKEPAYRKIFEQKLVAELKRDGVDAMTTFDLFPDKEKIEESEAVAAIKDHGIDGVLLVRIVDSEKKEVYTPGYSYVTSSNYRSGWYGYYGGGYTIYTTPGQTYNYRTVTAETVLYDLAKDKMVWSTLVRVSEEKKFELIESYIKGIHKPLLASGVL